MHFFHIHMLYAFSYNHLFSNFQNSVESTKGNKMEPRWSNHSMQREHNETRHTYHIHTYHVYVEWGEGSYMCVRMLSVCHVHGWAHATKLTDLFRIPLSPRASCTSLTDMALGRSCLLANTNTTASRNSSSWSYVRTQVKENERNPTKQDYSGHSNTKTLLH